MQQKKLKLTTAKASTTVTDNKLNKYKYYIAIIISILIILISIPYVETILDKSIACKFEDIKSIEEYAKFYPENYEIENNDWTDPSFINFYKKYLDHSFIEKLLVKIGYKKTPIFSIHNFKNLLEKLTPNKADQEPIKNYNKTLELKAGQQCFIFGDIHASLHSFFRNLNELEKQNIIDKNLKIISKDNYIILLGDAINRAPYSLETLNIILVIMEKNPENFIYLKGNHETRGYWQNFNMKKQLKNLFPEYALKNNPNYILDKIDKFFETLPNALIINVKSDKKNYESKIICSNTEKKQLFENKKEVKFMIIGEKRFDVLKETQGLEFIGYEAGASKWSTISCPSIVYQKFFNFHYDAFIELTIGKSAEESIITLNSRNLNSKSTQYNQASFNPIFGKQLESKKPFIPKNTFTFGSTMSLTGITAPFSNENRVGLVSAILENNNIKKTMIKPIILDDGYWPKNAKINVKRLLESYSTNVIVSPTGTPTISFYLDMIKAEKIFVFFPYTGAEVLRDKEIKNLIHFRGSYTDEIKTSITYLIKEHGIKNFAFFYQDDSYGKPIAKRSHEELKKHGIQKWIDLPHLKTQSDFKDIAYKIKSEMPEAIGLFSTNTPSQGFIEELGAEFFSGRIIFGVSFVFSEALIKFLDDRGIKYVLVSVVPEIKKSNIEIVNEFIKIMDKNGFNKTQNALEGFISGSLIAEAINKIKAPYSPKEIMEFFEKMQNYKFKGLNLTFNPEKRNLSQPIFIRTLNNKWINYEY